MAGDPSTLAGEPYTIEATTDPKLVSPQDWTAFAESKGKVAALQAAK